MFFVSTFLNAQKKPGGGGGPVAIPNSANALAVYKRTGPFFQDSAGTIPATTPGDPVKFWTDSSGNGNHATWSAGNVPTLRSGGGVDMPAGGAQLEAPVSTRGSNIWSAYQRGNPQTGFDLGWSFVEGNPPTPQTGFAPAYAATGMMAFGMNGTYDLATIFDGGIESNRGMTVNSTTNIGFINNGFGTQDSILPIYVAASLSTIKLGNFDATFGYQGYIINCLVYSTHDDAVARGLVFTYQDTE